MIFSFKRWSKIIVLSLFALFAILHITVTIVIDPYGDLNLINTKFNYRKFVQSYNSTPINLINKLKNGKFSLVFGTSRSGKINSDMLKENILNFSSSLYGNPADVYHILKQLNDKQMKNIEKIYYLIDTHTFYNKKSAFEKINIHSQYSYLKQIILNLNADKIMQAIECVKLNTQKKVPYYFDKFGVKRGLKEKIFDPKTVKRAVNESIFNYRNIRVPFHTKKSIEYLKMINDISKKNNIKIIYFTPVYNVWYLKMANLDLYRKQFTGFLNAIDYFYDFHYIKNISHDANNFTNIDHPSTNVTLKMIQMLENSEIEPTNKENLDYKINKIKTIIKKINL